MTTGQPPALTILCTGGAEMPQSHTLQPLSMCHQNSARCRPERWLSPDGENFPVKSCRGKLKWALKKLEEKPSSQAIATKDTLYCMLNYALYITQEFNHLGYTPAIYPLPLVVPCHGTCKPNMCSDRSASIYMAWVVRMS